MEVENASLSLCRGKLSQVYAYNLVRAHFLVLRMFSVM